MTFYGPAPTTFLLPGSPRKCVWPGRAPSDQHSITFALPHLKTINTPSRLESRISKRPTLHHFCAPTAQNDQHSITFTFLRLKTINTPSLLHSYISKRSTRFLMFCPARRSPRVPEFLEVIFLIFPTSCSAHRSPRIPESEFCEISDVLFCTSEYHNS